MFAKRPNCPEFCTFMGRTIAHTAKPKYIICDPDKILDCDAFRRWVKRKGIKPPRYERVGEHGSIAVVERFILSLKTDLTRRILMLMRRDKLQWELERYQDWYNEHRRPDEICRLSSEIVRSLLGIIVGN